MYSTQSLGCIFQQLLQTSPSEVLDPRKTWADGAAYDTMATELANKFKANDQKYDMTDAVKAAGPTV